MNMRSNETIYCPRENGKDHKTGNSDCFHLVGFYFKCMTFNLLKQKKEQRKLLLSFHASSRMEQNL